MTTKKEFYNINHLVNANATKMVDNSKWITWSLDKLKKGMPKRKLNKLAHLITE